MAKSALLLNATWLDIRAMLDKRTPFHNSTGKFRGELHDPDMPTLPGGGQMSIADRNRMRMIHDVHGIDYIVYSYSTPIAYRDRRGIWCVPDAGYSQTTKAKHLSRVRPAVASIMSALEISA